MRTSLSWMLAPLGALLVALTVLAAGVSTLPGDVWLTHLIQEHLPAQLTGLMQLINDGGETTGALVFTLVCASALAVRHRLDLAALLLLTIPLRFTNVLLKAFSASPRPTDELVRVTEPANGYGFPSGHVMGATLLYGALLIITIRLVRPGKRRTALLSAILGLLLLTGVARVYVGAHWPSDVVGGYLWGSALLLGLTFGWSRVTARRRGYAVFTSRAVESLRSRLQRQSRSAAERVQARPGASLHTPD